MDHGPEHEHKTGPIRRESCSWMQDTATTHKAMGSRTETRSLYRDNDLLEMGLDLLINGNPIWLVVGHDDPH